jgi:hypothetical protein
MRCNSCSSIVNSGEARKMNANSLTKDKNNSNQTPNKCTPLKYLGKEQLRNIIVNDKNLKINFLTQKLIRREKEILEFKNNFQIFINDTSEITDELSQESTSAINTLFGNITSIDNRDKLFLPMINSILIKKVFNISYIFIL